MIGIIKNISPIAWSVSTLSDITLVNPTFDKSKISDDMEVSFVPMAAVQTESGFVDVSNTRKFSEVKKGYTPFSEGDILFAKITPCMENGKMAIVPALRNEVGFGSTEFHVLRPLSFVSTKFVYFFVSSKIFRSEAERYMSGAVGQRRVTTTYLATCEIPLPPLSEQNEIVSKIEELFSELDNGVQSLKKAREQLKTYRQAVLKYAFEGRLTREWREQHLSEGRPESAEKLLGRIKKEREKHYQKQVEEWQKACEQAEKDGNKKPAKPRKPKDLPSLTEKELAELPELPKGWGWVTLEMILSDTLIGIVKNLSEQNEKGIGVPYIKMNNISKFGTMDYSSLAYVEVGENEKIKYSLKANDVLFNTRNSYELVGKTGIVRKISGNMVFNNNLMRMRFIEQINPVMIWYQINSPQFQKELERKKKATTNICALYGKDIFPMKIKLTNLSEQQAIVSEIETRLSVCDQLEQTIEDSLKKAEALRQSILKKAFEGELTREWRLAHPELISGENSAESLLERIRAEKERLKGEGTKRRSGKIRKK